jgi:hypothetical protein
MTGRRHDPKGRSTYKLRSNREQDKFTPPAPFVQTELALMTSHAWRTLSLVGRKVVERVIVEHFKHDRSNNGWLPVTYLQFKEYGIREGSLSAAFAEAEALGFIRVTVRGRPRYGGNPGQSNMFALTFVPQRRSDDGYDFPTNDWRKIESVEEAERLKAAVLGDGVNPNRKKRKSPTDKNVSKTHSKVSV